MSRKKNAISYLLLMICICMQVSMAFPHHHHSESLCIDKDLAACPSSECTDTHAHHHSDDADRHSCSSLCITKFQCDTPHQLSHIDPGYTFYTLLYFAASSVGLSEVSESRIYIEEAVYRETLHIQCVACAIGLRAPPVFG